MFVFDALYIFLNGLECSHSGGVDSAAAAPFLPQRYFLQFMGEVMKRSTVIKLDKQILLSVLFLREVLTAGGYSRWTA